MRPGAVVGHILLFADLVRQKPPSPGQPSFGRTKEELSESQSLVRWLYGPESCVPASPPSYLSCFARAESKDAENAAGLAATDAMRCTAASFSIPPPYSPFDALSAMHATSVLASNYVFFSFPPYPGCA
ncbi:hypothetical protein XA68_14798 [Ophiocordyceps unilateralis]|uniref:Uncharacterized protein n=1 Tax=Ophiocordyceps unilateralis TaxID=268505 RepID=A0A2A9P7V6_OPHUN|nr:hypothetical protein XA68_14798 [Ophiocordyceps unilateralis]